MSFDTWKVLRRIVRNVFIPYLQELRGGEIDSTFVAKVQVLSGLWKNRKHHLFKKIGRFTPLTPSV